MAALADFHPYLLGDLESAPNAAINQALVQAIAEFCTKTEAWTVTYTGSDLLEPGNAYDLSSVLPANTSIANIVVCIWDDRELDPAEEVALFGTVPGQPLEFGRTAGAAISLNPPPQTAGTLTAKIAVRPQPGCAVVDDKLLDEWAEIIAHGTKYRVQSQPNKPWTSKTANYHFAEFDRLTTQVRREIKNGRLDASRRTIKRSFY